MIFKKRLFGNAQSALEFVILVGAVLFFFVIFLFGIQQNIEQRSSENIDATLKETAFSVQNELNLAFQSLDGYYRTFDLPERLLGLDYEISVTGDGIYIRTTDEENALALSVSDTIGDLVKGTNVVRREGGKVYLNVVPLVCGNGAIEVGEGCDDGNTDDFDGCSASCQVEDGSICETPGQPCRLTECNDGVDNDDNDNLWDENGGGALGDPGCWMSLSDPTYNINDDDESDLTSECQNGVDDDGDMLVDYLVDPGCSSFLDYSESSGGASSTCGDGAIGGTEECDDFNVNDFDGCSASCQVEPGWICTDEPSACVLTQCNDGIDNGSDGECDWNGCRGMPLDSDCADINDDSEDGVIRGGGGDDSGSVL